MGTEDVEGAREEEGELDGVVVAVAATCRLEITLAASEKIELTELAKAARELLRLATTEYASLKI